MQTSPAEHRKRSVSISVIDKEGHHARGARVEFAIGGQSYGEATIGTRPASIEFPDRQLILEVRAELLGETLMAHLSSGQNQYTFQFSTAVAAGDITSGVARCSDGRAGQPCVDCVVNGVTVRICA